MPEVVTTIVLVHGAFAGSHSWNGVIPLLAARGHRVVAHANPLRTLAGDAASLSALLRTIDGPVVLVGHSYGGAVIANAHADNIIALVFVAAFAPTAGESCAELTAKMPGSSLEATIDAVPLEEGGNDLYIRADRYAAQFCADVDPLAAALDAVTQRPLRDVALAEASGEPNWLATPSWFLVPGADLNIPPDMQRFMAERAGARSVVDVPGASHAVAVSEPTVVADLILAAAATRS